MGLFGGKTLGYGYGPLGNDNDDDCPLYGLLGAAGDVPTVREDRLMIILGLNGILKE
jgi:hypothetical protein